MSLIDMFFTPLDSSFSPHALLPERDIITSLNEVNELRATTIVNKNAQRPSVNHRFHCDEESM